MLPLRILIPCFAFLALAGVGSSQAISLSFNRTVSIASIPLTTVGDLAIDRDLGHLYLCDGAPGGQIYRVDPNTGTAVTTHASATIPGLNGGPDALALSDDLGDAEIFLFSPFGESRGGQMTLSNALVADFGTAHDAVGADTTSTNSLWIASGTAAGGGTTFHRLNPSTGSVLFSSVLAGTTERATDMAWDPWFNQMWVLSESGILRRVDLGSGTVNGTFDLNTLVSGLSTIHGGIAFGPAGNVLYVARGTGTDADALVILDRQLTTSACTGDGASGACPCGNTGSAGRGCDNSASTGGALLRGFGLPLVSNDFLELRVEGLPSSTTCLFFQGTSASTPAAPFGDGLRCVNGTIIRLATKSTTNGTAVYPTTSEEDISLRGDVPVSGGTRHYQVWYRNSATFCTDSTFNLSNGITVGWRP